VPAIRAQSLEIVDNAHGIVTLVTHYGTIVIDIVRGGAGGNTSITYTVVKDGVQVDGAVIANATIAAAEAWASQAVSRIVGEALQFRVHFFSLNPLSAQIGCFNGGDVIPSNWWQ
jgi:hypothetical protein